MMSTNPRHIPTLGYPNQKAAIIALFELGNDPYEIAVAIGCAINSVQRALSEYRRRNGIPTPPRKSQSEYEVKNERHDSVWDMPDDARREEFARRAARAAREARLAA
jgi:hypothetical protein